MHQLSIALGMRIKSLRNARCMSQEELGFKASISPAHLGQIERARKKPTVETIGRIADALEIPVHELFLFDSPVVAKKSSSTIDKINAYLFDMTEKQQKDIYKVIKIFKNHPN